MQTILIIGIALFILAIIGGVGIYFVTQSSTTTTPTDATTTASATSTNATATAPATASGGTTTTALPTITAATIPVTTTPTAYPILTLNNMTTPWNDEGGGNMIYLDRHDVSCPAQSGMSSFHLVRKGDGNFHEEYGCLKGGTDFGAQTDKVTPANEDGGGNTTNLDRHDVQCPDGSVMNDWHITRPTDKQIQVNYKCVSVPGLGNCETLTTPWNDEGGGSTIYLDRHNVQCPGNKMLTRWKLNRKGDGNYHYEYTCCGR